MPTALENSPALAGARTFNIRDFGALGDAKTLDTPAIQSAIDAAAADLGGTVLIPAGTFLVSPLELKSNITLHLAAGATLLGSTNLKHYHPANGIPLNGDHTMGDGNTGLLYAANATNIAITGPGTVDGQGHELRYNPTGGLNGNRRCHLALFYKCTNLRISDLYLFHSEYHTLRICNSSYVTLDGIRIFCRTVGNNDGFHFISADHVNITNCNVRCQDDACALFGSCQFIMITNSTFSTRWSCFRFGGGIAENIVVSNCLLYQVFGCPIKLRCEPGSRYENISFSNIIFQEATGPISLGAGPMRAPGQQRNRPARSEPDTQPRETPATNPNAPAIIRNISFHNITGNVITHQQPLDDSTFQSGTNPGELHSCIIINCVEGNIIENISFSDIHLTFGGGGTAEDAARRQFPNIAGEYFALGPLPAYAFYARNARALTLHNLRFQTATPDLRPALILDNIHDAAITTLALDAHPNAESALRLINCEDILLSHPRLLTPTKTLLQIEGQNSTTITLEGTATTAFANGAKESALTHRQ